MLTDAMIGYASGLQYNWSTSRTLGTPRMHQQKFQSATTSKDDDCLMVAFGDAVDGSANYVIFQLAGELSQQDINLGMNGIYFEFNDQAYSGYKLVNRIEIAEDAIVVDFETGRMSLSEDTSPFRILYDVDGDVASEIRSMLETISTRAEIEFVNNASQ
ncbi:Imm10 family immunity protein [Pacificibacter marinus]|uniref:Uncharacterized protein n=1 Tax=Pacificibacter marinus TaxID=658057 RepID=A0A1Y5TRJ1_9RHOB|nr:Imm10 family immunity protein [Pacificibacter marinus]SEL39257.1 Immunity protein 10 [Pacificibacter marinus]SLN70438.1 hypothetical protein PAM7971_03779 [Pacificibacter marinus]